MITIRDDDNYDTDFTNKQKAIEYGKELKRTVGGVIDLWTFLGEKDDEHAVFVNTEQIN